MTQPDLFTHELPFKALRGLKSPLPGPYSDTLLIPLTMGKNAIIDRSDFGLVRDRLWYARKSRAAWYAMSTGPSPIRHIYMHREILKTPSDMLTDHINFDGLDNRRCNLRPCTVAQNRQNTRTRIRKSEAPRGVRFWSKTKRWNARVKTKGKTIHLGYFASKEEAAKAYDEAARVHFGRFARLNFPSQGEMSA